jgi:hypothetical protein
LNPGLRTFESAPTGAHRMKAGILVLALLVIGATSARAGSPSYAQCGTYDAYLLIYTTTDRFEELGKLRCDEEVEVLSRSGEYSQIRTLDGRVGWVRDADLSSTPPPPHQAFTFGLSEHVSEVPSKPGADRLPSLLTNEDVLVMHAKHLGSNQILERITSSSCAFDTSPEGFRLLKTSGLSANVILAMLAAPVSSGASERKAAGTSKVRIPNGTSIEVELNGNVVSEEAGAGTIVEMLAAEDLVVNSVPVILRGSSARARIMAVERPGSHGSSGQVAWFMQDIATVSGDRIPVTFASKQPGSGETRNFEGYTFMLSEFHKGGPVIKAGDKRFRVVIHGDIVLQVSPSLTADLPPARAKSPSVRQVSPQPPVAPEAAMTPPPSADGWKP